MQMFAQDTLRRILDLSLRISRHSVAMKPFVRFSKQAENFYKNGPLPKPFFWNFDDSLQKILLSIARKITTPQDIYSLCIEQWKNNLERLAKRKEKELRNLIENETEYSLPSGARDELICSRLPTGSRFLYIGCGAGTQCLVMAKKGYHVIGIDTNQRLVDIANKWAHYLKLPFQALCMDVMHPGFMPNSFDGFLLEFYSGLPSQEQALLLQRNLAAILTKQGKGFIVASRKKYASYWYRMYNYYPKAMTQWLKGQSQLDFFHNRMGLKRDFYMVCTIKATQSKHYQQNYVPCLKCRNVLTRKTIHVM